MTFWAVGCGPEPVACMVAFALVGAYLGGVPVDPVPSVVLVSLCVSLVVEGTAVVRGNRGLLPSSTSIRVLFFDPPSPEHTPIYFEPAAR